MLRTALAAPETSDQPVVSPSQADGATRLFTALIRDLENQWAERGNPDLAVAVSGGVDSMLLMHALAAVLPAARLRVLHVDHQMHPDSARWAARVAAAARQLGLVIEIMRVKVPASGAGPEGAARRERYRAFSRSLKEGEVLVTAHHRDDQVETLMLRARVSSLPSMLGGMPAWRELGAGYLWRPLLGWSRASIGQCAVELNLGWIEDPANRNLRLPRNQLRHRVLPLLERAQPGISEDILRFAGAARHISHLGEQIGRHDLAAAAAGPDSLRCADLAALGDVRRHNLLRYWLDLQFERGLGDRLAELLQARVDAQPEVRIPPWELRRYRDLLWRMPPLPSVPQGVRRWNTAQPLDLGPLGRLDCVGLPPTELRVSWMRGGERIRLPGRRHHSLLKKLWQEAGVPPWIRQRTPLLWAREDLVAVGARWISASMASRLSETGRSSPFQWRHNMVGDPSGPGQED